MKMSAVTKKLNLGYNRIREPKNWIKGSLHRSINDIDGDRYEAHCILGAVNLDDSVYTKPRQYSTRWFIIEAIATLHYDFYRKNSLTESEDSAALPMIFNDYSKTTHKQVLNVLKLAIEMSHRHDKGLPHERKKSLSKAVPNVPETTTKKEDVIALVVVDKNYKKLHPWYKPV